MEGALCESKNGVKRERKEKRGRRGRNKGRREREGQREGEKRVGEKKDIDMKPNINRQQDYSTYSYNLLRLTTNHRMTRMVYQQHHLVL